MGRFLESAWFTAAYAACLGIAVIGMGCGGEGFDDPRGSRIEGTEPGDCEDGADNDADGLFDCDDTSCAASPPCADGGAGGVGGSMLCAGVDCDDSNECTEDACDPLDETCDYTNLTDGTSCDFGGLPGVCMSGVCEDAMLCASVDCDDSNECTQDVCDPLNGECGHTNVVDDTACDFGSLPGLCVAGVCEDAMLCASVDCNDSNECTQDACDPMDGSCGYANATDGTSCDFGGLPGICGAGVCEDAMLCTSVDCEDGNECTEDTCDPMEGTCEHTNVTDGTSCDFGGFPGVCAVGVCEDAMLCASVDCDDSNGCTQDVCDPLNGECGHTNVVDDTACDFGSLPGLCVAGVCEDAMLCASVDCNDSNECTQDACDPMDGSCGYANATDGTSCDFGGLPGICGAGVCEDAMLCTSVDCEDGNECTEDTCDPMEGTCEHTNVTDGTSCDFGGFPGVCAVGACEDAMLCASVDCDDSNECTQDVCDPLNGECGHTNVVDDTACDFGSLPGLCVAGVCEDAMLCASVDCNDSNECTQDACDPMDGSCGYANATDGTSCDFGGLPGICGAGVCEDAMLCTSVDCEDGNECTEDTCDPMEGTCEHTNVTDGTSCDFGGLPGICGAGVCEDAMLCAGVDCDDGNECTEDTCDPMDGSCGYANVTDGTSCDFGGFPGVCAVGVCEDAMLCAGVDCDDGNECTEDTCDPMDGQCEHTNVADGASCDFVGAAGVCETGACRERSWGIPGIISVSSGGANPRLAIDDAGNVIVVWHRADGAIASSRYTPNGGWSAPVSIGVGRSPDIAVDAGGNATAVWQRAGAVGYNIWSSRFTPGGGWTSAVLIENDDTAGAGDPHVASDAADNALAVWTQSDLSHNNVWSNRIVAGSGWGTAQLIETNQRDAYGAQIASSRSGDAVAVWFQHDRIYPSMEIRTNIWANRFRANQGWSGAILLDIDDAGHAHTPQVSMDANGAAIAVWTQSDGVRNNVWWSSPFAAGAAQLLETDDAGDAYGPQVSMNDAGDAVAVWIHSDGASNNIWAKRYFPLGNWGEPVLLEMGNGEVAQPHVSVDAAGNAVAVWFQFDGTRNAVRSNRYVQDVGWGDDVAIDGGTGTASAPRVSTDANGTATVVWAESGHIWANRFE